MLSPTFMQFLLCSLLNSKCVKEILKLSLSRAFQILTSRQHSQFDSNKLTKVLYWFGYLCQHFLSLKSYTRPSPNYQFLLHKFLNFQCIRYKVKKQWLIIFIHSIQSLTQPTDFPPHGLQSRSKKIMVLQLLFHTDLNLLIGF